MAPSKALASKGPRKKVDDGDAASAPWPSLPSSPLPLELTTLLEDQIVTVSRFFTAKECASLIAHATAHLPFSGPKPPGKDEAVRTNHRWSGSSPADLAFLRAIWTRLGPVLEPAALEGESAGERPAGLHSNLRMYRYTPGQLFERHYDDSLLDPLTRLRTGWTLLIYLSGVEDGVVGGETVFYGRSAGKREDGPAVVATLERGLALLHRHGRRCMLHEALPVEKGVKWVVRTDLLFAK